MSPHEYFLYFLCERLKMPSPRYLKQKLTDAEIVRWMTYHRQKNSDEKPEMTDAEMEAAFESA